MNSDTNQYQQTLCDDFYCDCEFCESFGAPDRRVKNFDKWELALIEAERFVRERDRACGGDDLSLEECGGAYFEGEMGAYDGLNESPY
jgi:hypothetical protein